MARHKHQGRRQGGGQRIGVLLSPKVLPQCRGAQAQHPQKEDQAHHAGGDQSLNIVIMGVFGLVKEGLHTQNSVFKGTDAQAKNRAAVEKLHAVGKKDSTLNGVLVGKKSLKAVGDKTGEKFVVQLQLFSAALAGVGGGIQGQSFPRAEAEVDHLTVFGNSKPGPLSVAPVKDAAGVHHGLLLVLTFNGHAQRPGSLHIQSVAPRRRVGGTAQALSGCQVGRAGEVQRQDHKAHQQRQSRRYSDKQSFPFALQCF